jgi:hypothetical protein
MADTVGAAPRFHRMTVVLFTRTARASAESLGNRPGTSDVTHMAKLPTGWRGSSGLSDMDADYPGMLRARNTAGFPKEIRMIL